MSEIQGFNLIGKRIGNYVVERNLARGAMGTVCIARHPTLGREVAVKFIGRDVEIPDDHQRRFLDEACITANLRHPNIIDIFDFGELDGRLYYVMELLHGRDLSAVIRDERRFDVIGIQTYVSQICAGLQAAHEVGIVHRDLKPSNIFVLEGQPTRVKLMDFGVAKVMSAGGDRTHQGQIIGTPRYMSPEQALGQVDKITPQSDIYALGVILYEMLTGRPVFEHDSPMMLLVMHVRDEVRPIRGKNPDVPAAVSELIESCLAKRPEDRPTSARELAERFESALGERSSKSIGLGSTQDQEDGAKPFETSAPAVTVDGGDVAEATPRVHAPSVQAIEPAEPTCAPIDADVAPAIANEAPPSAPPEADVVVAAASDPLMTEMEPSSAPRDGDLPVSVVPEMETGKPDRSALPSEGEMAVVAAAENLVPRHGEGPPNTLRLTKADRTTLNRLWTRMQRGGDFPAFIRNVGEVSKRADFEGAFSATQLGDSILKDFALTAKLLRVVNSTYANRFGGKVYSVQHAIVILGFDRVRSLALSISLFKKRGSEEQQQQVSDSAIHSLASGELAQQLAPYARVFDEEQAMMCAMFRNMGRHLAIVYLPEMYNQMLALCQSSDIGPTVAAERVFGLSLQKIGIGVAERWCLPKPIVRTMSAVTSLGGLGAREEDRVVELADFSNELCDIIINASESQRQHAISNLLMRHKNLINIDQERLAEILQQVRVSFEQRYASLLGLDAKESRFARSVATMVSEAVEVEVATQTESRLQMAPVDAILQAEAVGANARTTAVQAQPARPKPQAQRIQLARVSIDNVNPATLNATGTVAEVIGAEAALTAKIANLSQSLSHEGRNEKLVGQILKIWVEQLGISKLLLLKANLQKNELTVVGGIHSELDALGKEFKVPISPARTSSDVFSQTYFQTKDIVVEDTYAIKASAMVPLRFYETIGAPSIALYGCACKGYGSVVILVQAESPRDLPSAERVKSLADLRQLLVRAVA